MTFDYDAFYTTVADQFLSALAERLPDARSKAATIRDDADALLDANAHLVVDQASRANVRQAALVLASYRALSTVPADQLREALANAYSAPFRQFVLASTRHLLDSAEDPFAAIVGFSKQREGSFFGPSFTFDHRQDDRFAYLVDVRRCVWHAFFVANGAPELTPVFCRFDADWIDAIDPAVHGFRFERPTTLGYGGDCCRFWFIRTERPSKNA
jgi:hypothetical protein